MRLLLNHFERGHDPGLDVYSVTRHEGDAPGELVAMISARDLALIDRTADDFYRASKKAVAEVGIAHPDILHRWLIDQLDTRHSPAPGCVVISTPHTCPPDPP